MFGSCHDAHREMVDGAFRRGTTIPQLYIPYTTAAVHRIFRRIAKFPLWIRKISGAMRDESVARSNDSCSEPQLPAIGASRQRGELYGFGRSGSADGEKKETPSRSWGFHCKAPGSDLLSHGLSHTTIGAGAFHFRVRDGNGWDHTAVSAREPLGFAAGSTIGSAQTLHWDLGRNLRRALIERRVLRKLASFQ